MEKTTVLYGENYGIIWRKLRLYMEKTTEKNKKFLCGENYGILRK